MQKVISNKRYNTETAVRCGGVGSISLYKKKTGEFFIADSAAETIAPLTYKKAKEWSEKNGLRDVEQFFSFEPGKTVTSFSLPKMTVEQLKQIATHRGESSSQVLADLIYEAYTQL